MERILLALLLLAVFAAAVIAGRWWVRRRAGSALAAAVSVAGEEDVDRVLLFTTEDCVQCREMQRPALERLRERWPRPLIVEEIDAIARRDMARQYGVLTVPSTVVFAGGQPRGVNYGFVPAEKIARQLRGDSYTI
ncbi:MAG: thioredoxin [Dehalococcoidia bacterium]|nr:thioredoxin [Dehalococcoidia bacterium]